MSSLPKVHLIYETDAPRELGSLVGILQRWKEENRIADFDRLEDFLNLHDRIGKYDMVLILLTKALQPKLPNIENICQNLLLSRPNVKIVGLMVDDVGFNQAFITFPTDLVPIRNQESPEETLWEGIANGLQELLPHYGKEKNKSSPSKAGRFFIILGVILVLAALGFVLTQILKPASQRDQAREVIIDPGDGTIDIIPEKPDVGLGGEDCLSIDPQGLTIVQEATGFLVMNGRSRMMMFRSQEDAEQAVNIIRHFKLDRICYVGRPNPGLTYFTSNGSIPTGSFGREDCITLGPSENLTIRQVGDGRFQISNGQSLLFMAGSMEEAERIVEVIRHYSAAVICYVGRPNPGMGYLKR